MPNEIEAIAQEAQRLIDRIIELERVNAIKWAKDQLLNEEVVTGFLGIATDSSGALVMINLFRRQFVVSGLASCGPLLIQLPDAVAAKLYPIHLETDEGGFAA